MPDHELQAPGGARTMPDSFFPKWKYRGVTALAIVLIGLSIASFIHYGLTQKFSGCFIASCTITPIALSIGGVSVYQLMIHSKELKRKQPIEHGSGGSLKNDDTQNNQNNEDISSSDSHKDQTLNVQEDSKNEDDSKGMPTPSNTLDHRTNSDVTGLKTNESPHESEALQEDFLLAPHTAMGEENGIYYYFDSLGKKQEAMRDRDQYFTQDDERLVFDSKRFLADKRKYEALEKKT